jgi:hypothetical protein
MRSSWMPCYGSQFCSIQISIASSAWPCNSYLRIFDYVGRFGCVPRSCSVMMRSCRGCSCGYFGTKGGFEKSWTPPWFCHCWKWKFVGPKLTSYRFNWPRPLTALQRMFMTFRNPLTYVARRSRVSPPQKKRFAILGQQVECSEWSN